MFLGEFVHTLDSKGRLTIPAKFRDRLAAGLVVTRNPSDRCLLLMPMSEWTTLTDKIKTLPLTDRRTSLLRRVLFSAAEDLKPDKQGRVLVSQRLREFAHIDNEVMVVGMDSYVELWDPSEWDEQVLQKFDDDLDTELFTALGV
jgi:MraZ protein